MTSPNEDDRCGTCGQTYGWHQENNPVHPFNFGQDGATDFLKSHRDRDRQQRQNGAQRAPQGPPLPTDPVLRIALVNAGVLKPADLVIAEEQLRAALADKKESSWLATREESSDSSTPPGKMST